jgi:hypothetical protein
MLRTFVLLTSLPIDH